MSSDTESKSLSTSMIGRGPEDAFRPFTKDLLVNKKAIVTGGFRGIGLAITEALLLAGAKVAVIARRLCDEDFQVMCSRHGWVLDGPDRVVAFFQADLADAQQAVQAANDAIAWAGGCIDVLCNNAGISFIEDFVDITTEKFDAIFAVNTRATMLLSRAVLPGMIQQKWGKIVNISSQCSVIAHEHHAAYCASKAALTGLMNGMVCDVSKHNIQINNLSPTISWSAMGIKVWSDVSKSKPVLDKVPMGRFVEPWEIANMVVFLSSDACTMCVGQNICISGGYTNV